jgi:hypothetical protein
MDNRSLCTKLAVVLLLAGATPCAQAGVVVSTSGNQAFANISLTDGVNTYAADVTITFDAPANLTADELNLTAAIVDPTDATLTSRLPGCLISLLPCVTVDLAFPVLITVEPLDVPWLFHTGLETGETIYGNLSFHNTYTFEVHTADLTYVDGTPYRLFKAPLNGSFDDISAEILNGSVRARGSGGTFSQFLVVADVRDTATVELLKELNLELRIINATLINSLRTDLLGLVDALQTAVLGSDFVTAIADLDQLVSEIQANAGTNIANTWRSDHTLTNDAGEMLSLAQTLRFTLVRLQNGQ